MEYAEWLAGQLGEMIAVLSIPALGYVFRGGIWAYFITAFFFTIRLNSDLMETPGDGSFGIAVLLGFGLPLLFMTPGLLIRFGLTKKNLKVVPSAAIAFLFWVVLVHSLAGNSMGAIYSALVAGMTFAACFTGFEAPVRRGRDMAERTSHEIVDETPRYTVDLKNGNSSDWVSRDQVIEWYQAGKINASSWIYPSDDREWARLASIMDLSGHQDAQPQPGGTQVSATPDPPAVVDQVSSRPPVASDHRPEEIESLTAKLRKMPAYDLMAMLDVGALKGEAEEIVAKELENRGFNSH